MRYYKRTGTQTRSPMLERPRRRPAQKVLLISCALAAAILMLGFTGARAMGLQDTHRYTTTVVQEHETLWDIALRFSSPDQDVRQVVYQIRTANSLSSAVIRAGDVLKVPVVIVR